MYCVGWQIDGLAGWLVCSLVGRVGEYLMDLMFVSMFGYSFRFHCSVFYILTSRDDRPVTLKVFRSNQFI